MGFHRRAWIQAHGPVPDGLKVLHRCDNPRCYEVTHLFLGTTKDNHDDMVAKGRGRGWRYRLTQQQVQEIRTLAQTMTKAAIARQYGVSRPSVSRIVNGKQYA